MLAWCQGSSVLFLLWRSSSSWTKIKMMTTLLIDCWALGTYSCSSFNLTNGRRKYSGQFLKQNKNRRIKIMRIIKIKQSAKGVKRQKHARMQEKNKREIPSSSKASCSIDCRVWLACTTWLHWGVERWERVENGRRIKTKIKMESSMETLALIQMKIN